MKKENSFSSPRSRLPVGKCTGKQTWSLEDCINYALEKNIQLQQNKIPYRKAKWM